MYHASQTGQRFVYPMLHLENNYHITFNFSTGSERIYLGEFGLNHVPSNNKNIFKSNQRKEYCVQIQETLVDYSYYLHGIDTG